MYGHTNAVESSQSRNFSLDELLSLCDLFGFYVMMSAMITMVLAVGVKTEHFGHVRLDSLNMPHTMPF